MYAQLGDIVFDGLKSFSSYSETEDAVIVEHNLISRKARLQGTAVGLKKITITMFFHQEFCNVKAETQRLREAKNSFSVLTLQWGNGDVEGDFVINNIARTITDSDSLGNIISVSLEVSLIECVDRNRLEDLQKAAQNNAFAVGEKKPTTKSNRVNPTSCSKSVSGVITIIKANAGSIDKICQSYTNTVSGNFKCRQHLKVLIEQADKLSTASITPGHCTYTINGVKSAADAVKQYAASIVEDLRVNDLMPNSVFATNTQIIRAHNNELQGAVKSLSTVVTPLTKNAVLNNGN